jgi:aminomethyltransferase
MSESTPQRTALYDCHIQAGAKMVEFAGWEMPVRYGSEIEEHHAVRRAAGLFDVSHMGEIRVTGPGSLEFLQSLTPNNVARLKPGRAHYSGLLTEDATYIDDILIYQLAENDYLLVVNASNIEGDFEWISSRPHPACVVENHSDRYALLALQGPKALEILSRHCGADLAALSYYHFVDDRVCEESCIVSRTGYTGEEGFELYLSPEAAPKVWDALLASGAALGLRPAGLGARDTLRLEAGMALYGHEIDRTTTPYEANLGWVVKLKKGDFTGRSVLAEQKKLGTARKLVGFEMQVRGIARQGHGVLVDGKPVGEVRSGTWSPTLEKAIGTAYLPTALAKEGTKVLIEVRKRQLEAVVVPMPFYRRGEKV